MLGCFILKRLFYRNCDILDRKTLKLTEDPFRRFFLKTLKRQSVKCIGSVYNKNVVTACQSNRKILLPTYITSLFYIKKHCNYQLFVNLCFINLRFQAYD